MKIQTLYKYKKNELTYHDANESGPLFGFYSSAIYMLFYVYCIFKISNIHNSKYTEEKNTSGQVV